MSPRKAKPKRRGDRDITHDDERELSTSNESIEEHDDGIFVVRKISGSTSKLCSVIGFPTAWPVVGLVAVKVLLI